MIFFYLAQTPFPHIFSFLSQLYPPHFLVLYTVKELSLCNKIKYLNLNIFRTRCCKPLIFQTQIIWTNRIHSLKYLRYATFDSKDIVIRKSEFAAKTQFLFPWSQLRKKRTYLLLDAFLPDNPFNRFHYRELPSMRNR